MKIELVLHDACAKAVLRQVARRYAILCVNSRMPSDIVNAPWARGGLGEGRRRKTWQAAYREWMAGVDRERAAYRKSLLSVLEDLPEVEQVELKPFVSPATGHACAGIYPSAQAARIADGFADQVAALALGRETPRPPRA